MKRNVKNSNENFTKEKEQNQISSAKLEIKSIDIKINLERNKKNKLNLFESQNIEQKKSVKIIKYKNCELNSFD